MLAEERSELHRFRNECLSAVHTYNTATMASSGSSTSGGLSGSASVIDDSGSGAAGSHPWGEFRKKAAAAPAGATADGGSGSGSTNASASQPIVHWPQLTASSSSSSSVIATGTEIGSGLGSGRSVDFSEAVAVGVDEGDDGAVDTGGDNSMSDQAIDSTDSLLTHLIYSTLFLHLPTHSIDS